MLTAGQFAKWLAHNENPKTIVGCLDQHKWIIDQV